jgi:hypothetical protein
MGYLVTSIVVAIQAVFARSLLVRAGSPRLTSGMSRVWLIGRLIAIALCIVGALWTASRLSPVETVPATDSPLETTAGNTSGYRSPNQYLYRMQGFFRPTLESNRKSFSGRSGAVEGFGAGEAYPQIWLRDSATLVPVSRFYYPAGHLTSWLEEHLSHQRTDGQLYDWIARGPASHFAAYAPRAKEIFASGENVLSADKNTVEADQETSAVIAIYEIFLALGDRTWLSKEIEGARLIDRLAAGLEYLDRDRIDPQSSLISSGFSADWGDVSPVYPNARAVYLDEKTPRVVGLYTNCLFYEASLRLADLYDVLGETVTASSWRERAAQVKEGINAYLWHEDKGFYSMHRVLTPELTAGWVDDADIFAMGSNGLAALYGIADDDRTRRIFDRAEERRREMSVSTVSGSLLPAYPAGFFVHPLMQEPYSYQNGGQWDWFGGRFVLAEFERGFSERAHRHLLEIARKVTRNRGFHEWQTRDGRGRGSSRYAGSAGALGAASFRGLFGIYLSAGTLDLTIRLGERSGEIQLHQPSTRDFVRYRYRYQDGEIQLRFDASAEAEGRLRLLLPDGTSAATVWIDGEEKAHTTRTVGEDRFIEVATDWGPHELRVQLK